MTALTGPGFWDAVIAEEGVRCDYRWYAVGAMGGGCGMFVQAFGPNDAARQVYLRGDIKFAEGAQIMATLWPDNELPPPSMLYRRLDKEELEQLIRERRR